LHDKVPEAALPKMRTRENNRKKERRDKIRVAIDSGSPENEKTDDVCEEESFGTLDTL